ncbi:hypothetical protein EJ03DRAFT_118801 [Teratosphaeria nubilosa]|uniref:Uncharacterized protein n=1 Tax=Teratosphaeria nubilosa TaxID=161662 RepID=A0A6G1L6F0_9PEZI|nr:hypothetical protein EJ03DRAFT_118801 [Teratosphaeria nubilosa]
MKLAALLLALFSSIVQGAPKTNVGGQGTCFFTPSAPYGFCDLGNSMGEKCPQSAPCTAKDRNCYVKNGGVQCT